MEIIPTVKIVNRDGIKAVKNGQKANKFAHVPAEKKPSWIRVKASFDPKYKLLTLIIIFVLSNWFASLIKLYLRAKQLKLKATIWRDISELALKKLLSQNKGSFF